jgi:hypothetical protein
MHEIGRVLARSQSNDNSARNPLVIGATLTDKDKPDIGSALSSGGVPLRKLRALPL